MVGEERRKEVLKYLLDSNAPVSGTNLAKMFQVSRQVIVQDIALLRARNYDILSTNRGYIINQPRQVERVFWVCHDGDQIEEELNTVVDLGGTIVDVFVHHQIYGELRATLNISSRLQVQQFVADIRSGKSKPLTNLTSGHHCHTICADSEEIMDLIKNSLIQMGIFEK